MFNDVLFFTYIFAGFAGSIAILIAVLLIKYWSSGNKTLLASIRNFMICTAAIDFIYFYIDYREITDGDCGVNGLFRVADICFYIGQVYFWTGYMREKGRRGSKITMKADRNSVVIVIMCIALAILGYGFLMDEFYIAAPGISRVLCMSIETLLCISLTTLNLFYLRKAMGEVIQQKTRRYMVLTSLMLIVNGVWNAVIVVILVQGNLELVAQKIVDPTPIFILAINIFTILLVFSEDFAPHFKAPANRDGYESGESESDKLKRRLDYIAEDHLLTEREREVMELAYNKMTNPEIAETLCISKYTVKNHMHNIFEKLDISTRADLVLFVDKDE